MATKRTVLENLSRAELIDLVDVFELDVSDRRKKQGLVDALAASRKASVLAILEQLTLATLKGLCVVHDLDNKGRGKAVFVERLSAKGTKPAAKPAKATKAASKPAKAAKAAPKTAKAAKAASKPGKATKAASKPAKAAAAKPEKVAKPVATKTTKAAKTPKTAKAAAKPAKAAKAVAAKTTKAATKPVKAAKPAAKPAKQPKKRTAAKPAPASVTVLAASEAPTAGPAVVVPAQITPAASEPSSNVATKAQLPSGKMIEVPKTPVVEATVGAEPIVYIPPRKTCATCRKAVALKPCQAARCENWFVAQMPGNLCGECLFERGKLSMEEFVQHLAKEEACPSCGGTWAKRARRSA